MALRIPVWCFPEMVSEVYGAKNNERHVWTWARR
jgi:hypothetical protein